MNLDFFIDAVKDEFEILVDNPDVNTFDFTSLAVESCSRLGIFHGIASPEVPPPEKVLEIWVENYLTTILSVMDLEFNPNEVFDLLRCLRLPVDKQKVMLADYILNSNANQRTILTFICATVMINKYQQKLLGRMGEQNE
jgi:hypothetical protein